MIPIISFGQTNAVANTSTGPTAFGQDEILATIVVLLLIPIFILANVFRNLVRERWASKIQVNHSEMRKISVILFLLCTQFVMAGPSTVSPFRVFDQFNPSTWLLLIIFFIELGIIIFFTARINSIVRPIKPFSYKAEEQRSLWEIINSFRPIKDESKLDTGHEYDGIRELNNVIPPWFNAAFALTVVFAGIYLYRYHYAKTAPLSIQEYKMEMAEAMKFDNERLANQVADVDENTVTMMGASDIAAGKATFAQLCAPCHKDHGGSNPGGVGPNLTDDYWIHGGALTDVFKSIKYGWPEKGMISWKDQLSANQIAQISSFIKSIKGSNPPNAKEPQGDLYKETAAAPAITDTSKSIADTTKINK